ncbi:hypothetical protein [Devosia sediminis]|uniref:Uncharacterized protein n=1 Tax=Devosia sediminis TaxID=2798801 RepID=A0A934IU59_9HYPH|nr:hypothetical protein [Devosia sediminis]MBJ3786803.1 hypothetical protein [Devosia sediminis]
MVKINDTGPVEDDRSERSSETAALVYRDKDGRPHIVPEQEQAAHDAQRSEERKPDLPLNVPSAPD